MKKSKNISLCILPLLLLSCASPNYRNCVDKNGRVYPDTYCSSYSGTGPNTFLWYYATSRFTTGQVVRGGSYIPAPGRSYTSITTNKVVYTSPKPATVTASTPTNRNGFGSSGLSGSSKSVSATTTTRSGFGSTGRSMGSSGMS